MFKVIIQYDAWDSIDFRDWKSTISSLTSMDFASGTENLDTMDRKLVRCWPWPESIEYQYDVDNQETIILAFNSASDWDECRGTPEFQDALDFESLEFFTYLNVELCKVVKKITKWPIPKMI